MTTLAIVFAIVGHALYQDEHSHNPGFLFLFMAFGFAVLSYITSQP